MIVIPLKEVSKQLTVRLAAVPHLALGLDYDGTLVPIRTTPSEALPSQETRDILTRFVEMLDVDILLLTGRSADDLASMLRIPGIAIAGNHGLDRLKDGKHVYSANCEGFLINKEKMLVDVARLRAKYECIKIEEKGVGIAIHYRGCPSRLQEAVCRAILEQCHEIEKLHKVKVKEGKKVVELLPDCDVNKGSTMVSWLEHLRSSSNILNIQALYAGDDITDEDVFSIAPEDWVTIQVGDPGDRACSAEYVAENTEEFQKFLMDIYIKRQKLEV